MNLSLLSKLKSVETTSVQITDRFGNIDALRALAALLVVAAHTAEIVITHVMAPLPIDTMIAEFARRGDIGRVGVIAFFCISGYLIPMTLRGSSASGMLSFLIRRATRIYPAFWLSLLTIVVTLKLGFGREFLPTTIAANLTMVPSVIGFDFVMGHYWTLSVELAFYLLCVCAFLLGLSRSSGTLLCCMALCFITVLLVDPRLGLMAGASAFVRVMLLGLGLMFWASSVRLMREDLIHSRLQRLLVIAVGSLFGVGFLLAGIYCVAIGIEGELTRQLIGTGFGVAIFLCTLRLKHSPNFAIKLGSWSYSIYLFHPVPLYALHALAEQGTFGSLPGGSVMPAIVIVGTLTILIAAVTYRLVEAPAMAWGHKHARRIELKAKSDTSERALGF